MVPVVRDIGFSDEALDQICGAWFAVKRLLNAVFELSSWLVLQAYSHQQKNNEVQTSMISSEIKDSLWRREWKTVRFCGSWKVAGGQLYLNLKRQVR